MLDAFGNWMPLLPEPVPASPTFHLGSAQQTYSDSFSDPNGNVAPENLALAADYYQDTVPTNRWSWSVDEQVWLQYISNN